MGGETLISEAVSWLFDEYKKEGIRFCVLRNYNELPERIGSDIDILLEEKFKRKNEEILKNLTIKFDLRQLPPIKRDYVWIYRFFIEREKEISFLKLDFHIKDEEYKGLRILAQEEIFSQIKPYKNFFVPSEIDESILILIPRLLAKVKFREKDKINILKGLKDEIRFGDRLTLVLGDPKIALEITENLKRRRFDFYNLRRKVFLTLLRKNLITRPLNFLRDSFKFYVKELNFRLKPRGIWIALIGPDGSGKSTIAEELLRILGRIFINRANRLFHWKPMVIPFPGEIKRRFKIGKLKDKANNMGTKKEGNNFLLFSSLLRLIILWADYLVGYYRNIRPILYRDGLVVFDRYFYDFLVADPKRSKIKVPFLFKKLFVKVTPKPTFLIYMEGDPKVLYERKKEFSISEIKKQMKLYGEFLLRNKLSYLKVWTTDNPPEEIAYFIVKEILNKHAVSHRKG